MYIQKRLKFKFNSNLFFANQVFFKDGGRHGEFKTHKEMADVFQLHHFFSTALWMTYLSKGPSAAKICVDVVE